MRCYDQLPCDLRNIVMTAAAKWLGEQPEAAKEAFDRTVAKCRKQWEQTQEVVAVIDDCRQVIDEINSETDEEAV
jgi:TRAP-type C4-dicarboxylate transport system substrate-binding protein